MSAPLRCCVPSPAVAGWLLAGWLATTAGCELAGPRIWDPGTLRYQRARANRYDPFPDPDAGPAVPEARPREFSRPPPEPARARFQPRV